MSRWGVNWHLLDVSLALDVFNMSLNSHDDLQNCLREMKKHALVTWLVATLKIKPKPVLCPSYPVLRHAFRSTLWAGIHWTMMAVGQKRRNSMHYLISKNKSFPRQISGCNTEKKTLGLRGPVKGMPYLAGGNLQEGDLGSNIRGQSGVASQISELQSQRCIAYRVKFLLVREAHRVLHSLTFVLGPSFFSHSFPCPAPDGTAQPLTMLLPPSVPSLMLFPSPRTIPPILNAHTLKKTTLLQGRAQMSHKKPSVGTFPRIQALQA